MEKTLERASALEAFSSSNNNFVIPWLYSLSGEIAQHRKLLDAESVAPRIMGLQKQAVTE